MMMFGSSVTATSLWVMYHHGGGIFAHSDGVNWTAVYDRNSLLPKAASLGYAAVYRATSAAKMPVEAQALLAWLIDLKLETQPIGTKRAMPRPEMQAVVSDTIGRTTIVYQGYAKKVGEYTLAKIRAIVTKAVELCLRVWGWAPETIRFALHTSGRSMGLAYMPGVLDSTKTRRVSLNRILFQQYDAAAIHRVIVHELCHHYREEAFPRPISAIRDGHDARFCEQLQRVDAIVATNPKQCKFFEEQADPTILAAAAEKREAGVVWSPDAGMIVMSRLKSGEVKFAWESERKGAWKPLKQRLTDTEFLALLQRFSPTQWNDVRVVGFWRPGIDTLNKLLVQYLGTHPGYFVKTMAWLKSVSV